MALTEQKAVNNSYRMRNNGQVVDDIEMPPLGYVLDGGDMPPVYTDTIVDQSSEQPVEQGQVEEVLQQLQPEQTDQNREEEQEVVEQEPVQQVKPSKPTAQDSFKALRESKEKAERERDALMAQIMMQAQMNQKPVQQAQPQPVEQVATEMDFNIAEDALVEGKDVKKVYNEIKSLRKQLEDFKNQNSQMTVEAKIKANFPDFESVVSAENVAMLNEQYPDIAKSLADTKDTYAKASAAYTVMKKFGIAQINQEYAMKQNEKAKVISNIAKPRPINSISPQQGDSPLSKANAFANGMTKELKEQLFKEMMEARSRY